MTSNNTNKIMHSKSSTGNHIYTYTYIYIHSLLYIYSSLLDIIYISYVYACSELTV